MVKVKFRIINTSGLKEWILFISEKYKGMVDIIEMTKKIKKLK